MRVLVFGDSITFGAWDSQGGWVDRLKRDYNKQYQSSAGKEPDPHQVVNLGIGGDTSRGVLARFEHEYLARRSANWQPLFVIAIGTNDSRHVISADSTQVPEEEYRRNLRNIIQLAREYSQKLLLVGLFPLREETLHFKDYLYSQSAVKRYDAIIEEVAKEFSIPKVELFHPTIERADHQALYFVDGLHPNDAGHKIIHERVKAALEDLIRER